MPTGTFLAWLSRDVLRETTRRNDALALVAGAKCYVCIACGLQLWGEPDLFERNHQSERLCALDGRLRLHRWRERVL
jgi:hypothetical protein